MMKKLICVILTLISLIFAVGCESETESISVYSPDGAPALSLVKAMDSLDGYDFNIVGADIIQTVVTGSKKADICILPINLASKLLNGNNDYKMLGVVTHGNFYFISSNTQPINRDTASSLVGQTVGVVQLQSIAGLTLKASLDALDIPYNELVAGAEVLSNAINLLPITASEVGTLGLDYYLAPSPLADVRAKALNFNFVGSLKNLYSESGFPQAVIVCKTTLLNENLPAVKKLIDEIKGVNSYLETRQILDICSTINDNLEQGLTPSFNQNNLSLSAIENSSINFISIKEHRAVVDEFITRIKAVAPNAVNDFSSDFYYLLEL